MARRRSGKKIDFLHWTHGNGVNTGLAAGTTASTLIAAQHLPETLMRTRGNLLCTTSGVQAPAKSVFVAGGIILVPEGTGTTVLWSPITDSDAPWIWVD